MDQGGSKFEFCCPAQAMKIMTHLMKLPQWMQPLLRRNWKRLATSKTWRPGVCVCVCVRVCVCVCVRVCVCVCV